MSGAVCDTSIHGCIYSTISHLPISRLGLAKPCHMSKNHVQFIGDLQLGDILWLSVEDVEQRVLGKVVELGRHRGRRDQIALRDCILFLDVQRL